MDHRVLCELDLLMTRYPVLSGCREDVLSAYRLLADSFRAGGKLLVCGNGGSAADAEHIVGELMKSFCKKRKPSDELKRALLAVDGEYGATLAEHLEGALPAIALDGHPALSSAFQNDVLPTLTFAQQVNGYGCKGDVLLAITTSGNSQNVLYAAVTAKAKGMTVIGLTGEGGGKLAPLCDTCIKAPERETYRVQEYHLPIYHTLCLMIEETFFQSEAV